MSQLLTVLSFVLMITFHAEAQTRPNKKIGFNGYLRAQVLQRNASHTYSIFLSMSGQSLGVLQHADTFRTYRLSPGSLNPDGASTIIVFDYSQLMQNIKNTGDVPCEFPFSVAYSLVGPEGPWIGIGQFYAQPNGPNVILPLGMCDGKICSNNAEINRQIEVQRQVRREEHQRLKREADERLREKTEQALRDGPDQSQIDAAAKLLQDQAKAIDADVDQLARGNLDPTPGDPKAVEPRPALDQEAVDRTTLDQMVKLGLDKYYEKTSSGDFNLYKEALAHDMAAGLLAIGGGMALDRTSGDLSTQQKIMSAWEGASDRLATSLIGGRGAATLVGKDPSILTPSERKTFETAFAFIPGLNTYKDVREAATGKSLFGNRYLTASERTGSVIGVLLSIGMAGGFDEAKALLKELGNDLAKGAEGEAGRQAVKDIEGALDTAKGKWDSVEGLLHTVKGNTKLAEDGTFKLRNGMHTEMGLEHFLNLNSGKGKDYTIKEVTSFAERNMVDGVILRQELPNGVTRVQLPREAWANSKAFGRSGTDLPDGRMVQGIKTLWPRNYSVADIAEATNSVVRQNIGSNEDTIVGVYREIQVRVNRTSDGKIISSFPHWNQ